MKYLKMLGLAVVAAAALSAVAGAGSASATEACKATENPCSEANMYKTGQEVHAVLTLNKTATLTGALNVVCKKSTFKGSQENTGSNTETLKIKGEELTFGECSVPGVCATATVTTNIQPTLEIHTDIEGGVEKPDNGIVTAKGFTVTVVCGGITCKYSGEVMTGLTIKGGAPAELIANEAPIPVEKKEEEFFCGKFGAWDAEYEVTTPTPLWII
jgi:hypothetical protein